MTSNSQDNIILNPAGGVGINTDNPQYKLDVNNGTFNSTTDATPFNFKASNPVNSSYLILLGYCSLGSYASLVITGDSAIVYNGDLTTHVLCIVPHSGLTTGIRMDSSGNVGNNILNPSATLVINGPLQARGPVTICNPSNSNCSLVVCDSNFVDNGASYGTVNIARYENDYARAHLAFIKVGSYMWEIGNVNSSNNFVVSPYNYTPSNGNLSLLLFTTSLKVGINTPTPLYTLDVNGTGR